MVTVALRRATLADLDRLAAIHRASARAAYMHIFPPAAEFPREAARAEIALHLGNPAMRTSVALRKRRPVGLIVAGPASETVDAMSHDAVGQIHLLHVHPEAQGIGVGTLLLEDALAEMRAAGRSQAILWVLVANHRARRFYERHGWRSDGARRTERHAIPVEVVRYRRTL